MRLKEHACPHLDYSNSPSSNYILHVTNDRSNATLLWKPFWVLDNAGVRWCCPLATAFGLPIIPICGADLWLAAPAAALSFVVPPFVFQFVQQALLVQFKYCQVYCISWNDNKIVLVRHNGGMSGESEVLLVENVNFESRCNRKKWKVINLIMLPGTAS